MPLDGIALDRFSMHLLYLFEQLLAVSRLFAMHTYKQLGNEKYIRKIIVYRVTDFTDHC